MNLAFETILIKDFTAQNIFYHEARLNKTRKDVFKCKDILKLDIKCKMQNAKCKIIYSDKIESIEFLEYIKQPISRLCFVNIDFSYKHKWLDRKEIDTLIDGAIMVKNGFITDTKIANIAFFDGTNWLTPKTPLLEGTTRARLLNDGMLKIKELKPNDILPDYDIAIMNALRGFENIGKARETIE